MGRGAAFAFCSMHSKRCCSLQNELVKLPRSFVDTAPSLGTPLASVQAEHISV